ncbi:MAG: hypothetical protein JO108_22390 [Acidobacteriaceae bacterium]|nr:hypothetical protein [Acidobacteriaceae bacterium]
MNTKQTEGARRRRSSAEVEQLVKEYEAGGLGRQAFCKKHGLSLSTLSRHQKRKHLGAESASQPFATGGDFSRLAGRGNPEAWRAAGLPVYWSEDRIAWRIRRAGASAVGASAGAGLSVRAGAGDADLPGGGLGVKH